MSFISNSVVENKSNPALIALFVYSRPWHTRQTVESLQRNPLAKESDLIVFSDAAKSPDKTAAVNEVREYIRCITGFRSVKIVERSENFGLANSIIDGVTNVLQQSERVIVLEDDMVTSPHFLTYMNDGLELYAEEEKVASIHGYIYPIASLLPETFFIRGADCWGWATWRRAWLHFNQNGQYLLEQLERKNLTNEFDFNNSYPYTQMLRDQIARRNDSWAIRWYASAFLKDMLTLYPGNSLVRNIGTDNSGTHCGATLSMDVDLNNNRVNVQRLSIEENIKAKKLLIDYFRSTLLSSSDTIKHKFSSAFSILKRLVAS